MPSIQINGTPLDDAKEVFKLSWLSTKLRQDSMTSLPPFHDKDFGRRSKARSLPCKFAVHRKRARSRAYSDPTLELASKRREIDITPSDSEHLHLEQSQQQDSFEISVDQEESEDDCSCFMYRDSGDSSLWECWHKQEGDHEPVQEVLNGGDSRRRGPVDQGVMSQLERFQWPAKDEKDEHFSRTAGPRLCS